MLLKSYYTREVLEAGCDEAGRGCLAGPVFAAAVIMPHDFTHNRLTDSKALSEKERYSLRDIILENAIDWNVQMVDNKEIDEINILNASFIAMHRALDMLNKTPGHILVDGNRFRKYKNIPHQCIIKGDALYYSIAAASILAKTYRDDYMKKIHEEYPCFNWKKNKGYPTKEHRQAISKFGIAPYHRLTFRLTDNQLKIKF